jgi:ribosomal protein S18 acetylase RimI-like enzyme
MFRPLSEPVEPVAAPAGTRLVEYTPDYDEQVRQASNIAFAEHWGSSEKSSERWQHFIEAPNIRRDLSYLLLDRDEQVAAMLISAYYAAYEEATGVPELTLPTVATLPAWRSRGAASALLAHSLTAAKGAGFAQVALTVDADNGTGAVGVYLRNGFEIAQRWTAFVRNRA